MLTYELKKSPGVPLYEALYRCIREDILSGTIAAVKQINPRVKVYGVQAEGAASMWVSRNNGKITELSSVSTIADGIAVSILH